MLPTVFVNHGGGPLPLMGRSPDLVNHMRNVVQKWILPSKPSAILVLSAHWESSPIKITSGENPDMLYDYYGFPPETYKYQYPAPGSPELARRVQNLLQNQGIESELDPTRGYDHGVFVPLMIMYPEADIPVVCVSLDSSLDAKKNMAIGSALQSLRNDQVLILGSGYTFHNMKAFFSPSSDTLQASRDFNGWLKEIFCNENYLEKLQDWQRAPGARLCHPREEHLLPLFMVAAAAGSNGKPVLVHDTTTAKDKDHSVTGYIFQ